MDKTEKNKNKIMSGNPGWFVFNCFYKILITPGHFLNLQIEYKWSRQASVSWDDHMPEVAACMCVWGSVCG